MLIEVKELELANVSEEYWNENTEEALNTVLDSYQRGGMSPELAFETVEHYFENEYDRIPDYGDLESDTEAKALAVYNLIDLTDLKIDNVSIEELL